MSQEIDERVVEMRFDNAQFERNTRQSIKTLNALNESLKLEGAEKSFEKIEDASAKVDFDKMQSALESLNSKFSAVEVMGVTALMRITNQAMDTGEKLVKSLSIDQVTSGWNKYAQKTASVQTIMNATGKSITKVNSYLEKLMWFSDETSYGFTDMTSALSTLTAAGGGIEKMIPMIMGMANATAYAGKGAAEFQRVIYNLAQSYGTGAIQLIDWKSVEQAGVASQQLKQLLIDTGVELGKIKKGAVTTGTFDNSLQKKWADKEVMETAFGKYAEFSNAVKEMVDANPGMLATQAIEALADQYDEVSVKAFKAAQEAKSFSEAVDATKDAVSSGWMETFDILFGNYEEAKGFWSDLAEEFWTMFAGGAAGRNNWLKSAFDSGLDQLLGTDGFGNAGDNYTQLLEKSLVKTGLLTQDAIDDAGSFQKALEESGVTAQQLESVIDDSADGYAKLLELSDAELKKNNLSREGVKKLADAYAAMAEKIQNGSVDLDEFSGKMNQLSGREHFFNGILNILDGINSVLEPIRGAFGEVFMTDGSPLYNFLKGFDELTGKMQLSEAAAQRVQKVFKGFFSVLNIGFKAVKVTVKTAFAILEKVLDILSPVTDLLLGIGSRIGEVLAWADQSMGKAESLTDVLAILVGAIGALVSPIGEVLSGFRSIVRGGSVEDAKQQFGGFAAVVNAVGGVLEKFKIGSISASGIIGKAVTVLGGILTLAFDGIGAVIGSAFSGFQDAGRTVEAFKESHVPMLETIRDAVLSIPEKAGEALKDFGGTLGSVMSTISSACQKALDAVKGFFNLQDGVDLYRLLALLDVGALALAIWAIYKGLNSISGTVEKIRKDLKGPVTNFFDSLTSAVDAWKKKNLTNNFVTIAKGISIAIGTIRASMYLLSRIDDQTKALQALGSVMAMLFSMVVAMKLLAKTDITGMDSAKIFAVITAFAVGMLAIAASVKGVAKAMTIFETFDTQGMNNAVGALMSIVFVLGAMVSAIGAFNYLANKLMASSKIKMGDALKGMSSYLAAATALVVVCGALYLLAGLDENKLMDAYGALLVVSLVMEGMVAVIGGLNYAMRKLAVTSGKKAGKATEGISAFIAVAAALVVAAGAVALFGRIPNLDDAMLSAMGMLVTMAGTIAIMSKLGGKAKKMKAGATAMLIASSSLMVMAGALTAMSAAMKADKDGAGFAGLSIALIALGAAICVLGKNAMESMGAAAALVAMGAALIEMAWAINMLAGVGLADLAKGILTMTASLAALAAGIGWLSASAAGIVSLAGACLMLATALLILTPAFKGLASLTVGEAFAGVISMIGILIGLFAVGSIAPVATGMTVFSACLISMAKAFSAFAGGLVKLGVAAGIFAVLAMFADPVCTAIIEAEPEIEEALIVLITGICNVIVACAEPLGKALFALAVVLTEVVVYYLAWALGVADVSMQDGLDQVWENLTEWFENHSLVDLFKSWVCSAAEALAKLNPFGMFGIDMEELPAQAGGWLADKINGFDKQFGTRIMGHILEAWGFEVQYADDATEALDNTANAANSSASEINGAAKALSAATNAANNETGALIAVTDEYGRVVYLTEDAARAMLGNADAADSTATAAGNAADAMGQTAAAMNTATQTAAGNVDKLSAVATQVAAKEGDVADKTTETLENGLSAGEVTAEEAGGNIVQSLWDSICSKIDELFPNLGGKVQSAMSSALNGAKNALEQVTPTDPSTLVGNLLGGGSPVDALLSGSGLTTDDLIEAAQEDNNSGSSGGTGTTAKSSSSKTKKTLAQQITEKYKTRLEANKALREAMDSEYELWQTENQYSADADTLLAKKTENAAAEIANQTDRVAIAQAKYDELYSKWGKDKTETKEAYADLLSEKTSLAKLKAEQYTNLFEDVAKRYDTNLSTLEKQYSLWTAENDKTATKTDKLNRETEYMTAELEVKQKKLANAQEQYDTLKAQYGEQDLRTLEAYNDLLDAQTEAAQLQADIANQELELIEAQIDAISSAQSRMQSRMDILSTAYDDGSLSERESAYEQAVEQYGKDSEEARKARFQGTTSAILSTVTALKNLNYQMQQTNKLQAELAELTPGTDAYDSKQSEILSSKSSFIGFASNLADALNMEDAGKRAMLIFANSIQDHWGEVSKAFQTVMTKVSAGMSEGMKQTFSDAFGWMSSDEGIQMETEFISAISSALQGDWGGALASAFAFGMDLAFSDAGKSAREWVAKLFAEDILPGIQNGSGQLTEVIGQAMGEIGKMAQGSGGVVETLGSIGTVLSNVGGVLMSFLSEFWWVFLIVGAIAAVIGGIAWYANKKKQSQGSGIYDVGKDLNKDFADGVEDGFDDVDNAVTDMTENAVDIARGALSTIDRVMGDDYEYTPQITPVVDLSNVIESADEATGAFEATTKAMTLDDDVSRKMAAQIEAQAEIQNGLKASANNETLSAINALGAHMDGVAQSIKGMSVNINGRKTIGYIDSEMGRRVAAKVR
ncbi:tape measure protein [Faecalibacterium prausnitzii]|uniref:tape measure protein n=1 Tax=Faecalibacterium prausnitzii TaxID=853 RepID=UPI0029105376|nr:tape measure protein [Faecalibacterium prausnitzii]